MKKLAVFYHLGAMNSLWDKFVDEQLGLIKSSGLADVATVNMCYAAPDHAINEIKIYVRQKYPFVNILSSRIIEGKGEQENLFEGQTLKEIQTYSKTNDGYVLYFHSKGMLHAVNLYQTAPTTDWRHYMNYWCVERWRDCIKKLEEDQVDLVSTNWTRDPYPHFSGNFWWADTNYVKTLSNVLDRSLYYDEKFTEQFDGHRFCYEIWISSNKPKVRSIHYSAVDHYYALYPRERYVTV
jgi:hypothetical protein